MSYLSDKRVRFYPRSDLACGLNLRKIERLVVPEFSNIDINDAIEYYNIHLYFEANIRFKTWDESDVKEYTKKSEILFAYTMRFFNSVVRENPAREYEKLDHEYHSDFWTLFNKCQLYNQVLPTLLRS